jgi:transcriptional regulator with XRE-family HTH domain
MALSRQSQGFTMEAIATQLGVTQRTISEDLRGLEAASKPPRPKGSMGDDHDRRRRREMM